MPPNSCRKKKVLAVASGGGHWIQLRRIAAALETHDVIYASTEIGYGLEVGCGFRLLRDGNLKNIRSLFSVASSVLSVIVRERPEVVISTGAAPGFFALVFGKMIGARTLWLDSIANADRLSVSGRYVRLFSDVWLTQWESLSTTHGPDYWGSVV